MHWIAIFRCSQQELNFCCCCSINPTSLPSIHKGVKILYFFEFETMKKVHFFIYRDLVKVIRFLSSFYHILSASFLVGRISWNGFFILKCNYVSICLCVYFFYFPLFFVVFENVEILIAFLSIFFNYENEKERLELENHRVCNLIFCFLSMISKEPKTSAFNFYFCFCLCLHRTTDRSFQRNFITSFCEMWQEHWNLSRLFRVCDDMLNKSYEMHSVRLSMVTNASIYFVWKRKMG